MKRGVILYFTLALSLVYGLRFSMQGKLNTIRQDCQQEIKISDEDLVNIRKNILRDDNEFQKCYMKCVLTSFNFMDKSGKITPEKGLSMMPQEVAYAVKSSVEVCNSIDGGDPCEKGMKIYRCIHTLFPIIARFV